MITALTFYLTGIFATLGCGWIVESRRPPHQRVPLSALLGLALLWPLYVLFLLAVAVTATRDELADAAAARTGRGGK